MDPLWPALTLWRSHSFKTFWFVSLIYIRLHAEALLVAAQSATGDVGGPCISAAVKIAVAFGHPQEPRLRRHKMALERKGLCCASSHLPRLFEPHDRCSVETGKDRHHGVIVVDLSALIGQTNRFLQFVRS